MALVLTCACGARFELDDALAGEQIPCPDCQVLVKAPDVPPQPRTSYWALASTILALTGAFTVVGTLAAIGCGIVALIRILRQPERVRGLGFALFGMIAGLLFTAITLFALSRNLFANWGEQMRETLLADQIDVTGPMVIDGPGKSFTLTRPTNLWGKHLEMDRLTDPVLIALNRTKADLTIVKPRYFAFVDVRLLKNETKQQPEEILSSIVNNYSVSNPDITFPTTDNDPGRYGRPYREPLSIHKVKDSPPDLEAVFDAECNNRTWKVILRLCNRKDKLYLVRAYVQEGKYARAKEEIMRAINSFKTTD
jgi:hypothetical protein